MKKKNNKEIDLNEYENSELNVEVEVEEDVSYEVTENYVFKYSKTQSIEDINIDDLRTMITANNTTTLWSKRFYKGPDGKPNGFKDKSKVSVTTETFQIPLKEISFLELQQIRKLQKGRKLTIPLFFFKENGKYYIAQINEKMSFIKTNIMDDIHLCKGCHHLSALPVEKGGCKKVIDKWKRLEEYPFIQIGYQTLDPYSQSSEVICICKCKNFEEMQTRSKNSKTEKKFELSELKEFIKDFK